MPSSPSHTERASAVSGGPAAPEVGQFVPRPALANGQALCTPDTRWEAIMSVTSRSSGRHSADLLPPHNFWREEEKAFSSLPLFVANTTSLLTAPFRERAQAGHGAPRVCRVYAPFVPFPTLNKSASIFAWPAPSSAYACVCVARSLQILACGAGTEVFAGLARQEEKETSSTGSPPVPTSSCSVGQPI